MLEEIEDLNRELEKARKDAEDEKRSKNGFRR